MWPSASKGLQSKPSKAARFVTTPTNTQIVGVQVQAPRRGASIAETRVDAKNWPQVRVRGDEPIVTAVGSPMIKIAAEG